MQSELIDKLDNEIKKMISSSEVFSDEKDYFINQKRKVEWEKLSELANSIVLIFDCYTHKFVFVSDNIPHLFGIDRNSLITDGHKSLFDIIHPDDIHNGFPARKKVYSIINSLPATEKFNYKIIHELRMRNIRDEYVRIIEQEQVIEIDSYGNIRLMMSVIDIDASHVSGITQSHLYNFKTGEQIFINIYDTLEKPLTSREINVLKLMKQGLLSKEIAFTLHVSINTVNTHRQNILQKLKANNSIEAVNTAIQLGLLHN